MATSLLQDSQDALSVNLLPSILCSTVVATSDKAIPVTAAWQFIRLAAKLYDDVEDGEAGDFGAEVTNLATGYLFAAHAALDRLTEYGISWEQSQRVKTSFNRACLHTCVGQDADLSTRWDRMVPSPDDWLEAARAKSGVLFAWASWAGALVAGTNQEVLEGFWKYGLHLGILVQIADDYNGIWGSPLKSDLSAYRVTLPISYAHFVANNDEREILLGLLREANLGNTDIISKGQDMLSALGTQKFILAAAQVQRNEAVDAICHCCLSELSSQKLITLLDKAFPALVHIHQTSYEPNDSRLADSKKVISDRE
jgi:geranylgeranyl pyrophosphate synthase